VIIEAADMAEAVKIASLHPAAHKANNAQRHVTGRA